MNRKVIFSFTLLAALLLAFFLGRLSTLPVASIFNNEGVTLNSDGLISMMIQDESGEYVKTDRTDWPTEGYNFNKTLSKCENGSRLSWRNDKVVVNTDTSDKCYIYFDLANGTEQFPYQIDSIEDLVRLSKEVAEGDTKAGMTYVLTRDLDFQDPASYEDANGTTFGDINGVNSTEPLINELTNEEGTGFKPIGLSNNDGLYKPFQGNFNGGNHLINNIWIYNKTLLNSYFGLFSLVENGEIKNLKIDGNMKTEVVSDIGGITGKLTNGKVNNCVNYATLESTIDKYAVGGIVGWSSGNKTEITGCINNGNLKNSNTTGGIIGNALGDLKITDSYNTGQIIGVSRVGGLVGSASYNLNMNNCNNTGIVTREDDNTYNAGIGGLIGYTERLSNVIIENSYNTGNITDIAKNQRVVTLGGLIGHNWGITKINNCYNTGTITKDNSYRLENVDHDVGGLIGSAASSPSVEIKNSHNSGDVFNGNRQGGLIGMDWYSKKIIISNSYNTGNVISDIDGVGRDILIGGLVGYQISSNYEGNVIILNSYNKGNVEAKNANKTDSWRIYASGILGLSDYAGNSKIINSYNTGNIKTTSTQDNIASGITIIYGGNIQNLYLNNNYNIGELSGKQTYGIGYFYSNTNHTTYNNYYKSGHTASNLSIDATPMSETNMKNQSFVTILNGNIIDDTTIKEGNTKRKLTDIDPLLEGYTLSRWELGRDGYPTLINE